MSRPALILITGTGRSGTSTMAGSLYHLGLHVPGPYLGANKSNPKGFYESKWSLRFHKDITQPLGVHDVDSRPSAFAIVQAALTPAHRAALVQFLTENVAGHREIVVKDPRTVWAQRLWAEASEEAGLDIRFVSMMRHPAEVVGSRTTYYSKPGDREARRRYETFNVARWVNASLISERETRGGRRSFVKYQDLLTDWRPVARRIERELGIRYPQDFADGTPHPVDDFIDPDLNRHRVTWDELDVPGDLRAIAEGIWEQLLVLHDAAGEDAAASARLDELSAQYDALFATSAAIAHDAIEEARHRAREEGVAQGKEQAHKRARKRAARRAASGPALSEASGRQLARALLGRVRGRVTRRG